MPTIEKDPEDPYNIKPGAQITSNFVRDQTRYQMLMEATKARTLRTLWCARSMGPAKGERKAIDSIDYGVGVPWLRTASNSSIPCLVKIDP